MAVDVVGYSWPMGRNESGTVHRLREHREKRFGPALARNEGRLIKPTGDGALVEFLSAVDALSAAIEFQQAMVEASVVWLVHGSVLLLIAVTFWWLSLHPAA